jgi:predicted DCC family thiol-disulfide oxidoreductase YuxK
MKKCIALIQSIGWLPFLVFLAPGMWGLALWLRDWALAAVAAVLSVYLVQEIWNWVGKKRTPQKESE